MLVLREHPGGHNVTKALRQLIKRKTKLRATSVGFEMGELGLLIKLAKVNIFSESRLSMLTHVTLRPRTGRESFSGSVCGGTACREHGCH